jgi:hypothetical protein
MWVKETVMAENKTTLDDRNKQTNKGANDGRFAQMNEEQRQIATKGGKAEPVLTRDAGLENPSQLPDDEEQSAKNSTRNDQRRQNSDDEINARGGIMGGAGKRGSRNTVQ